MQVEATVANGTPVVGRQRKNLKKKLLNFSKGTLASCAAIHAYDASILWILEGLHSRLSQGLSLMIQLVLPGAQAPQLLFRYQVELSTS